MPRAIAGTPKDVVIACDLDDRRRRQFDNYVEQLKAAAPSIGNHGLTEDKFWDSGLFQFAIERLRGQQAASMHVKKKFISDVLDHLKAKRKITSWEFTGSGERHDYQVNLLDGTVTIFEAKGCLDGNNTNIFQRPPNADEFFIWSLCQNAGSDPGHNAWSGIHTRLGATILAEREQVDALMIWDMLCGTLGRPCPKLDDGSRATTIGGSREVPPPCIYLFPRSIPDARNNPNPPVRQLHEVKLLKIIYDEFKGCPSDVMEVAIEARMDGANLQRRTRLCRSGTVLGESNWTTIRRAR